MELDCGSLKVIGPHNLIGSGTIRRYGFVGVGMASLEKCASVGVGFEDSDAQDTIQYLSAFPIAYKIGLSATSPVLCLPAHCHAPHHDDNGLNL